MFFPISLFQLFLPKNGFCPMYVHILLVPIIVVCSSIIENVKKNVKKILLYMHIIMDRRHEIIQELVCPGR